MRVCAVRQRRLSRRLLPALTWPLQPHLPAPAGLCAPPASCAAADRQRGSTAPPPSSPTGGPRACPLHPPAQHQQNNCGADCHRLGHALGTGANDCHRLGSASGTGRMTATDLSMHQRLLLEPCMPQMQSLACCISSVPEGTGPANAAQHQHHATQHELWQRQRWLPAVHGWQESHVSPPLRRCC